MVYMTGREPTVREARQMLTQWAAKQAAVSRERDIVIPIAVRSGLSKMEVHRLTGLSRPTIDRIIESAADGPASAHDRGERP
jgi:hypothetical protein